MVLVMRNHIRPFLFFLAAVVAIPFTALFRTGGQEAVHTNLIPSQTQSQAASQPVQAAAGKEEITIFLADKKETQTLPMADYIRGVVMAEMPASFEEEALKAQAVIAHTYALRVIANETASPSDDLKGAVISTDPSRHQAYLSDEEAKEQYGGKYEDYSKKIQNCVESVLGEILTYNDEPIIAAFHAMSSGNTEDAKNVWGQEVPYLVKCESEGDTLSPSFENSLTLTTAEVKKILEEKYQDITFTDDPAKWFEIIQTTPSGYVSEVKVLGQTLTGQELRSLFGLKSSDVSIEYQDEKFTFTTKGYGHGVGLSQYGADYMARQGKTYREILTHYYPNTVLTPVNT